MKICRKCNKPFKSSERINGIRCILSSRNYCLSCSPYKRHNTQKLENINLVSKVCPRCSLSKPISEFYQRRGKEGGSVYCKLCTSEQTSERQRALKFKAILYKGGKCSICGYSKCAAGLTFHHVDPSKKEFGIACCSLTSFEKIKSELDKCILVCYNCHMEIHYSAKMVISPREDSNLQAEATL